MSESKPRTQDAAIELDETALDEARGAAAFAVARKGRPDAEAATKDRKQMLIWYKAMQE